MKHLRAVGLAGLAVAVTSMLALPDASARKPKPPRWKTLTIQVSCEAMMPSACRGHEGFTIAVDGSYTVGPSTADATTGTLSAAELATVAAAAEALAGTSVRARPTCDKRPGMPGTNTTLILTPRTGKPVTLYQANAMAKGTNCTVGKRPITLRLESAVATLLVAHYPVPFPPPPSPPTPTPARQTVP